MMRRPGSENTVRPPMFCSVRSARNVLMLPGPNGPAPGVVGAIGARRALLLTPPGPFAAPGAVVTAAGASDGSGVVTDGPFCVCMAGGGPLGPPGPRGPRSSERGPPGLPGGVDGVFSGVTFGVTVPFGLTRGSFTGGADVGAAPPGGVKLLRSPSNGGRGGVTSRAPGFTGAAFGVAAGAGVGAVCCMAGGVGGVCCSTRGGGVAGR